MIKSPHFLVHTLNILNLHSSSLCHLMFLSNVSNICLLLFAQGAPKQKIHNYPTHVYWFILTLHFILENWLLFWYNCGLHWKKKNHLLRNLFFYASAVNVHIVAVWCSVIKKQNCFGLFWWLSVSVRITVERTGASRNITSVHLIFHWEEATRTLLVPKQKGKPSSRIGKGILHLDYNVATSTDLLINIRQTTKLTSCLKGKFPLYSL